MKSGERLSEAWNPICKGIIYGIIGKMQLLPGSDWKLLAISGRQFVGYLPGGVEVYGITKIAVASLSSELLDFDDLELESCSLHQTNSSSDVHDGKSKPQQKVHQTWNNIKSGANNITGKTNIFLKDLKEKEKLERRLLEELLKMFNDSGSFYYSTNGDLSNSRSRLQTFDIPYCWQQTDDRFFWNKEMLKDLIESNHPSASCWILPVIQGFVQVERCFIDQLEYLNIKNGIDSTDRGSDNDDDEEGWDMTDFYSTVKYRTAENMKENEYDVIVISRRSRHQAGTRYKRRGINERGHVANYVETEQIVCVLNHIVSHVQVRGSVPVFWSQPGTKYRPLPQIDRDFSESKLAFSKHFGEELDLYKKVVIVSLVESLGREQIIGDAFLDHIFKYNNENLTYVSFDFHEHCRGMKFENVSVLTDVLENYIVKMGFLWQDDSGSVMQQEGVFRINCMDCLDRTNVVQAAVARNVLEMILRKSGRLLPDELLPKICRQIHNYVWANNGDAISRQYAGTAAMKGDFTRTGERKMLGVMKDGYNSANRYYLNRFRDTYRQTVIDMMLGKSIADNLTEIATASNTTDDDVWTSDKEECIRLLVRHSELSILPRDEECLGGWALVDPFTFVTTSDNPQDEDIILMLTHEAYYVARYNDELEELSSYQRIPIQDLEKIEIGMESIHFRNQQVFMRLLYRFDKSSGYFHTMRTIQQRSLDESKGILLSIAEVFLSVCRQQGIDLKVVESKFDKRRSKPQLNVKPLSSKRTLSTSSRSKVTLVDESDKKHEYRRSWSLSNLDVEADSNTTKKGDLPHITVENSDNAFMKYHMQYSPTNMKEKCFNVEPEKRIPKSVSDSNIPTDTASHNNISTETASHSNVSTEADVREPLKGTNKMDAFFRKTKMAFDNVGPKFRDLSPSSQNNSKRKENGEEVVPFKTAFQKLNEKFINKAVSDVRNPLKMLPEFRSRIQTALGSPRTRRKTRVLTVQDLEKRKKCKTKIIEL